MAQRREVMLPAAGGRTVPACFAVPDRTDGAVPGVLVIHEAFGLNEDMRAIAMRFADHGYAALAPDLYAGRGPKPICMMRVMRDLGRGETTTMRDLEAARTWLAAQPEVDGSRIGVTGFCMGGGYALLYAARAPVGVSAPFYGAVPKEASELEGICPVVASYGGRDSTFVSHGRRLERHLDELGVEHDVKIYDEAGHSFMSRHTGTLAKLFDGRPPMRPGFHEPSSDDAWRRMLAFFEKHLGANATR